MKKYRKKMEKEKSKMCDDERWCGICASLHSNGDYYVSEKEYKKEKQISHLIAFNSSCICIPFFCHIFSLLHLCL